MNLDEAIGIANEMLLENKDSACTFYDVFSAERAEAVEILIQSGLEQVERARGQRDGSETTQRVEARMNKPNSKTAVAPWTDAKGMSDFVQDVAGAILLLCVIGCLWVLGVGLMP